MLRHFLRELGKIVKSKTNINWKRFNIEIFINKITTAKHLCNQAAQVIF